jgi:DNA-binding transcriptional LysR family regulator
MMTLRQIEVIRAVMIAGTITGAAKLLNVSAPGISRLVKYTERSLGVRFFMRQNGRYFPTQDAEMIFEQFNAIYKKRRCGGSAETSRPFRKTAPLCGR